MPIEGLGTLAESALGAYKTFGDMDMNRTMKLMQQQNIQSEIQKRAIEEEQRRRAVAAQAAEQEALASMGQKLQGVSPNDITNRLPGLIFGSKDPAAAARAAKTLQEGIGGAMPWDLRLREQHLTTYKALVDLHRKDPTKVSAQDLADMAPQYGVTSAMLENIIPEITTRNDVMKAFEITKQKPGAEAQGLRGALPGQPGITSGDVLAGQAGAVAQAQGAGHVTGAAGAEISPLPGMKATPQDVEVEKARRTALAKETPLDVKKAEMDIKLKEAELLLKQAEAQMDSLKRGKMGAEATQLLATARYYLSAVPQNDPVRARFDRLWADSLRLTQEGTTQGYRPTPIPRTTPGPAPMAPATAAPAPAAPAPATEGGKIKVIRKSDGQAGMISPQYFNPQVYDRAQ